MLHTLEPFKIEEADAVELFPFWSRCSSIFVACEQLHSPGLRGEAGLWVAIETAGIEVLCPSLH